MFHFTSVEQSLVAKDSESKDTLRRLRTLRWYHNWKVMQLVTHSTVWFNFGPFHSYGDAVQKNYNQDDMIKHLVSDDFIAYQPESIKKTTWEIVEFLTSCMKRSFLKQVSPPPPTSRKLE